MLLVLAVAGCGGNDPATPKPASATTDAPPTAGTSALPGLVEVLAAPQPSLPAGESCGNAEQLGSGGLDDVFSTSLTASAGAEIECEGPNLEFLLLYEMESEQDARTAVHAKAAELRATVQDDPRADQVGSVTLEPAGMVPDGTICVAQIDDDSEFRPYAVCVATVGRYALLSGSEDAPASTDPRPAEPGVQFLADWLEASTDGQSDAPAPSEPTSSGTASSLHLLDIASPPAPVVPSDSPFGACQTPRREDRSSYPNTSALPQGFVASLTVDCGDVSLSITEFESADAAQADVALGSSQLGDPSAPSESLPAGAGCYAFNTDTEQYTCTVARDQFELQSIAFTAANDAARGLSAADAWLTDLARE